MFRPFGRFTLPSPPKTYGRCAEYGAEALLNGRCAEEGLGASCRAPAIKEGLGAVLSAPAVGLGEEGRVKRPKGRNITQKDVKTVKRTIKKEEHQWERLA